MYALSQLIFIDSYSPGKRAAVCLNGNTNLNGGNGVGKTTMLRVLPLFFGAAPGQIVRQSGSNSSFIKYYFPRLTSYIIFEYLREDEKNLVVAFKRDQTLAFRFLKGAYDDALFFNSDDEKAEVIPSTKWATDLKLRGLNPSSSVGIEDYKTIIQSSLAYTGAVDRKRKAVINNLRQQFSFCRRGTAIDNIHLITTAILEREPSIGAIKEVLKSILVHSNQTDEEIPLLTVKSSKLSTWVNDRDAYHAMCECEEEIRHLTILKSKYEQCIESQKKYRSQAIVIKRQLESEITQVESTKELFKLNLSDHQKKIDKEKRIYLDEKNELESKLESLDKQISVLLNKKESYEKGGISEKQSLVKQLPALEQEKKRLENQYNELTEGAKDVESQFSRYQSELESDLQKNLLACERERNSHNEQYQSGMDSLRDKKSDDLNTEEIRYEKESEDLQEALSQLKENRAEVIAEIKNILPPQALLDEQNHIEEKIQTLHCHTELLEKSLNDVALKQQHHAEEKKELCEQAEQQRREKRELEQQLENLKLLKNPSNSNLLAFLRSNHNTWTDTVAKVVPESLLLRTDLSPELTHDETTLYGVKLDLSAIDTPRAADETKLQQELIKTNDEIAQIEEEIKRLERSNQDLIKETKNIEIDFIQSQLALENHKQTIVAQQKELSEIKLKIEQAKNGRKEKLQTGLDQLNKKISAQEHAIIACKGTYKQTKNSIDTKFKQKQNEQKLLLDEKQKDVDNRKLSLQEKYGVETQKLATQKKRALVDRGIDQEYLETLSSQLESVKQNDHLAEKATAMVKEYEHWLESDWSRFDPLKNDHQKNSVALNDLSKQWALQYEKLKEREVKLASELSKVVSKVEQLGDEMVLLSRMLEQYPDQGLDESVDKMDEPFIRVSRLNEKWKDEIDHDKEISADGSKTYNKIRQQINRYRESQPQKFLEKLSAEIVQKEAGFKDEWQFSVEGLGDYMRESHPGHLQLLQADAQTMGQQISDYYEALSLTHKNINSLGKQVSAHAQKVIASFPAISDLSVKVRSNLDQLEFWSALQRFSQSHQAWLTRTQQELPDEEFIERLRLVSRLIDKVGLNVKLIDSFDMSFNVKDQGQIKTARTTKELKDISSNGLSYLILIFIYTALVNMLRGSSKAIIMWPVDELRNFDSDNIGKLMALLKAHDIRVFSAFPDPDAELLKHYENRYLITKGRRLEEYRDSPGNTFDQINNILDEMAGQSKC